MELERKALYNLLRMSWLRDPSIDVEPWQVEDYRQLSSQELFSRLDQAGIALDKGSYLAYAGECDTPEELFDLLVEDDLEVEIQDYIYLILFELWRQLVPEKVSLSLFCDELDHQIDFYDQGEEAHPETLQGTLASLLTVLDENLDQGGDPSAIFSGIASGCANDIESFLYDFIAELFDNEDLAYGGELVEGFFPYVSHSFRFELLRLRLVAESDMAKAHRAFHKLVEERMEEFDFDFFLEALEFMVQGGSRKLFFKLAQGASQQAEVEDDFQELLLVCADFHRCLDHDYQEQSIEEILKKRNEEDPEKPLSAQDPDLIALLDILKLPYPPPEKES